ncbi:patatin-like protein 3 [Coffea arabica]|uniref:Patatin n=1 Tax=Coffea arabica TaxID=13443 RepID=A0ABM4US88_COFAR
MAAAAASTTTTASSMLHQLECNMDVDKLTCEIFSILENKFLFGYDDPKFVSHLPKINTTPPATAAAAASPLSTKHFPGGRGKVRILSIDAGGSTDGVLAAKSLAHLEATLRRKSGNPNARVADFFDVAAGAGAGGILAALLFTRGKDGRTLFTADEALKFVLHNAGKFSRPSAPAGIVRRVFRPAKREKLFGKVFGELTLKDTLKAVLIPCYDLGTGAPFLFSRADALEMDGCDFKMAEVCGATTASRAVGLRSTDGRKKMAAVGGGVAMSNPTAAAITHVLNNKQEFPFCKGVEDLIVVSLGNGEMDCAVGNHWNSSPAEYVRIAGDGAADMVDQAVSMAFGQWRGSNYVRIQGNGIVGKRSRHGSSKRDDDGKAPKRKLDIIADQMLEQKNVESVLFQGKKLVESTNLEKLEWFGGEVLKEQEWRKTSSVLPPVILKQSSPSSPPRSSSATTLSTLSSC